MNLSADVAVATTASAICIVMAGAIGLSEWRRRGMYALNAVVFFWLGIAYFVGASAALAAHATSAVTSYGLRTNLLALTIVTFGVLGSCLGTSGRLGEAIARSLPAWPRGLSKKEAYVLSIALITLALASRYLAFGEAFFLGSLRPSLPRAWGNYVYDLRHALLPGTLVAFHILIACGTRWWEKVLLVSLVSVAIAFSFLSFSRRPLVLLVTSVAVYYVFQRARGKATRPRSTVLIAGAAVLFIVAALGGILRWVMLQAGIDDIDFRTVTLVFQRVSVGFMSLDAYNVLLACAEWYQDHSERLLGSSFVQVISNPVPRALWEGKPESFGFTIAKLMGNYKTNFGPTLFGEGYANFGLLGAAFFGWVMGTAARWVAVLQATTRTNIGAMLVAMVSFEFFGEVRGDLQGMTTALLERVLFLAAGARLVMWYSDRHLPGFAVARFVDPPKPLPVPAP